MAPGRAGIQAAARFGAMPKARSASSVSRTYSVRSFASRRVVSECRPAMKQRASPWSWQRTHWTNTP
ncbi:hypothetical protein ACLESO_02170 [Pyxidicoccus sp. 3LG]